MTEDPYGRLGRRLRRILLLLPYAIKHPGVSVDELSAKFGVKRKDLVDDLNLVFMCGLPGYGPGDLIDVSLDQDRVYVRMADYFGAPFRLTPAEALALYAGGAALASLPGMEEADALKRALNKLALALGMGTNESLAPGVVVKFDAGPAAHLDTLQQALLDRRRVRLEYLSVSRGEMTEREIDPWGLFAALGRWYLIAWDHGADDERMFRTDRIKSVAILASEASLPEDFDPSEYRGAFRPRDDQPHLTMEISPDAARWFEDSYPVLEAETADDGWRRVTLVAGGESWAAALLVSLGRDARKVRPRRFATVAGELARSIAARYET